MRHRRAGHPIGLSSLGKRTTLPAAFSGSRQVLAQAPGSRGAVFRLFRPAEKQIDSPENP